ncbi:protein PATRONUS 2 [Punica granatum]|uniref:Protein PATRONUS 2 n=1 Tax=Punica granatum TaxID=22663 RepID=A0A6P8E765_PUNGR|nr:protein PATRONUS 2 [Punica granatum]
MAGRVALGQRILQDENMNVKAKKTAVGVGGQSRSLKTAPKNGGVRLGSRRALNDITNKSSSSSNELLPKKKDARKEESIVAEQREFNAAEERFLHDHSKCIKAQRAALNAFNLDLVLPGFDSESKMDHSNSEQAKAQVDIDSPRCYPEPVELPMSEFSYWNYDPTQWDSPPCSPIHSVSPFIWQFDEEVEFVLKQENDV